MLYITKVGRLLVSASSPLAANCGGFKDFHLSNKQLPCYRVVVLPLGETCGMNWTVVSVGRSVGQSLAALFAGNWRSSKETNCLNGNRILINTNRVQRQLWRSPNDMQSCTASKSKTKNAADSPLVPLFSWQNERRQEKSARNKRTKTFPI